MSSAIIDTPSLLTAIEDYMNRDDIAGEGVSQMCVSLGEARLNRMVRHPRRIGRDDAFSVSAQYVALPTDFHRLERITLADGARTIPLVVVSIEEMADLRMSRQTSGEPKFVTITGTELEFCPTPAKAYTGSIVYSKTLPSLASNTSNWLLSLAPDLYLYAALTEAYHWAQDDAKAAMYESKTRLGVDELRKNGDYEAFGGTPRAMTPTFG
jgi:hypothetical protein